MTKKRTIKNVHEILTQDEMELYRRHIDDGNALADLTEEFGMSFKELHLWFRHIEDKLRRAFQS